MKFTIPDSIPRAALVTGGMRQTGIVNALAGAGFAIALQCHPGDEADPPAGVVLLEADLSDEARTASLIGRATEAVGPIGVLVNAASTFGRDTWDDATRATWDMHIETNLRAPFVLIQRFARSLPLQNEGVVINLLDQRLCPHLVSYTLSKAALWTLTQTMALALAPRIRVNGIAPAPAMGLARDRPAGQPDHATSADEIGRAALAILALSSMTGQMIVPDGVPPAGGKAQET
jgi:NAD(P)-dependent dehydrogenase (short-subunit alcohol dehydrogenase family)